MKFNKNDVGYYDHNYDENEMEDYGQEHLDSGNRSSLATNNSWILAKTK